MKLATVGENVSCAKYKQVNLNNKVKELPYHYDYTYCPMNDVGMMDF